MKSTVGFLTILTLGAFLAGAVGCANNDDDPIPMIAGEYALEQALSSDDACQLGDPIAVPIGVTQAGDRCVLTAGVVPGPQVCGAVSEGTVHRNRDFPASGVTVFPDYWSAGCDLLQTDDWRLSMGSNGSVSGTWSISYTDNPPGCSPAAAFFPCTNDYDVAGQDCVDCAACPTRVAGTPQRPSSVWMKR